MIKGNFGSSNQALEAADQPYAGSWHSACIIHYLGDGLYSVGLAPSDVVKRTSWEWLLNLNIDQVAQVCAAVKLTRCPTDKLKEILRGIPQ